MNLKILEEKDNPFFERKELKILIDHQSGPTPKKEEVRKEVASLFKVSEEQVIIDYIMGKKGLTQSVAKVKILKGGGKNETQTSKNSGSTQS